MRPIKFRGRDLDSGEYVFFNLEDILLDVAGSYSEYVGLHNIDPESVAEFVGYDANGKEVYEGDILLDDDGAEFIAQLQGVVRWELDDKSKYADMPDHLKTVPFDFTQQHTPLTLKEQSK